MREEEEEDGACRGLNLNLPLRLALAKLELLVETEACVLAIEPAEQCRRSKDGLVSVLSVLEPPEPCRRRANRLTDAKERPGLLGAGCEEWLAAVLVAAGAAAVWVAVVVLLVLLP